MCDLKLRTTSSYSYSVINQKEKYFSVPYFTARHSRNIKDKKVMELMVGSKHLNSKRFRSKYVRENRHILTLVYNIRACLYEESQPG